MICVHGSLRIELDLLNTVDLCCYCSFIMILFYAVTVFLFERNI